MNRKDYKKIEAEFNEECDKDVMETLKRENAQLKRDLEIAKLRRENRELRKQIEYNDHYTDGWTYTNDYPPYTTTPSPYTTTPTPWTWTITLCGNNLSDSDKKEIISNIKNFLAD